MASPETSRLLPALLRRLGHWLTTSDPGLLGLRRAGRTAIVAPGVFALCDRAIGDPDMALFAGFGAFATLMFVDFGGPMRDRVQAQAALGAVGAVFVCVGTLASWEAWLAAAAMAVVGFGVLFAGVVSSTLAGATTSLLLTFILPVSLPGTGANVPDRLAGWALASAAGLLAIRLLWPAPARDPLRGRAAKTCRALGTLLRSQAEQARAGRSGGGEDSPELRQAVHAAESAAAELQRHFLATPYRPTGLNTTARAVVRLIDQLTWLNAILGQARRSGVAALDPAACAAKSAAADVLDEGADLLEGLHEDTHGLQAALTDLRAALTTLERDAVGRLPMPPEHDAGSGPRTAAGDDMPDSQVTEVMDALHPSFRAQELGFVVSSIGADIDVAVRAEHRTWTARLLGREPAGAPGTLSAAQKRAVAHVERHSVWMHNSVRGAIGLGLAVLVASLSGVQHSFWVVLGTLSVLRSNALNTGQNALHAVLGTAAGFLLGALLLMPVGQESDLLWLLLPIAILVAGFAPAAISFAAGQAAFTLVLVILFNIIQPTGWRVGLLRIEDVAIGCAVSVVVGVLLWPRGAAAALNKALAGAYSDTSRYLAGAVEFGMRRCDSCLPPTPAPTPRAARAAARRMDDAFRQYLAERGAKTIPLDQITRLIGGVAGLRLAADAVLDLWERNSDPVPGDRTAARLEVTQRMEKIRDWYDDFAESLDDVHPLPPPLSQDPDADSRLVRAVRADLRDQDGQPAATAVRMIWTGDHLETVRRLQPALLQPALAARPSTTGRES